MTTALIAIAAAGCSSSSAGHARVRHATAENQRPGDRRWFAFHPDQADDEVQGYASAVSVVPGGKLSLYISVRAPSATADVRIYRMGWYGGAGARLCRTARVHPGNQGTWSAKTNTGAGLVAPDPDTGLVDLHWRPSLSFTVPRDWMSGYYLAKLTESATGKVRYVPFIVRAARPSSPLLVQASVTTWNAYNDWGGASLYRRYAPDGTLITSGPQVRAQKVSFNRPDSRGVGTGDFFELEYPFVRWLERNGIDADYTTDIDTHERPRALESYRGFVVLGHDEYWSLSMRNGVESAIAKGVNVAFLSANEAYWKIRMERDSAGHPDRILVCYKRTDTDPVYKRTANPLDATVRWRDPPINRPEATMVGVMYTHQGSGDAHVVSVSPAWLFAGTALNPGTPLGGIVGYEYDRVFTQYAPRGLEVFFEGAPGVIADPDTTTTPGEGVYQAAVHTAPSGATVFAAGTMRWSWALDRFGHESDPAVATISDAAASGLQRMTVNLLKRLAAGQRS